MVTGINAPFIDATFVVQEGPCTNGGYGLTHTLSEGLLL